MNRLIVVILSAICVDSSLFLVFAQSCENGGVSGRCVPNASACVGVAFAGRQPCTVVRVCRFV
jgi:hypothetical protein